MTPFLRKKGKTPRLKHHSTVELVHNLERERKEIEFRHDMEKEIMKVAVELKVAINEQ